jgi:uncharacterized protein (TIGR02118 family)
MIKLCVQYPAEGGSFFDFDYYLDVHLPMSETLLAEYGFLGYEVQHCTTTISGDDPEFLCITQLEFSSLEELREGMQERGAELSADFARYTDIKPIATVTEVIARST